MTTLYDLTEAQRKLYEALSESIDEETGEVDAAIMNAIDENTESLQNKFKSYAIVYKQLMADFVMYDTECTRLDSKRKSIRKNAEALKERLESTMLLVGVTKLEDPKASITFRKSTKVEVDENLLPKKYFTKKVTVTPDKTTLTKLLKEGMSIKGAALVEKQNIQIK